MFKLSHASSYLLKIRLCPCHLISSNKNLWIWIAAIVSSLEDISFFIYFFLFRTWKSEDIQFLESVVLVFWKLKSSIFCHLVCLGLLVFHLISFALFSSGFKWDSLE